LTGADQTPVDGRLSAADRKSAYEILLDTKRDVPGYWRSSPAGVK
jgi:hypothetical protein